MAIEGVGSGSNGVAFLVSAGVMYEIIAAACSSPQTTELNAGARADTLMKWVNLGVAQGVGFVVIAAVYDRRHAAPILLGGGLAAVLGLVKIEDRASGPCRLRPPTRAELRAPVAGFLREVYCDEGDPVTPGPVCGTPMSPKFRSSGLLKADKSSACPGGLTDPEAK